MPLKINSDTISKIFQSRNIILDILTTRGYNTDDYKGFNINEIEIQYKNNQLDMLLEEEGTSRKLLVKYHLETKLKKKTIWDMHDDIFNLEEILSKDDELLIITKSYALDTIHKTLSDIYNKEKTYINIFNIEDYLFNILEHSMVPRHRIMTEDETNRIKTKYNIKNNSEFPDISRFEPVARTIGIRPGQVCEITRSSETSVTSKYYRLCHN